MAEYYKRVVVEESKLLQHQYGAENTPDVYIRYEPAADVVEVVRCGECIHNYGIKANCEFNPHDIVCDYWSTDGMDEKDFCSSGKLRVSDA